MGTFDYASKIRSLLDAATATDATADRESDPEAAEGYRKSAANYRARAEELMIKYRVAEEEALAAGDSTEPIMAKITLTTNGNSPMSAWYSTVFGCIARHTGIRYHTAWQRREHNGPDGRVVRVSYDIVATAVGYEGDVRYAEFLWTAAYLMFSTKVDPVWDDNRTEAENIYYLRNAGIERRKIADRAWGNGTEASARSRVQRIYLKECERRGEVALATGLSHDTDTYRQSYARAFRDTLNRRLQEARDAADSVHGAITLHGRAERVDEAFYTHFPAYRPDPNPEPYKPCDKCQPGKPCRDHRITAADRRYWDRMVNSPSARAGAVSGQVAAEGVIIERGHTKAQRIDDGPTGEIGS